MLIHAAGSYAIIVSSFSPKTIGRFRLHIESTHAFDVANIPQEGAGMYKKTIKGKWKTGVSAGGSPKFGKYHINPRVILRLEETSQIL
jgi:calpain-7